LAGPFFPYEQLSLAHFTRSPLVIATPSATQHNHVQSILKQHHLNNNVMVHARHYGAVADMVFGTDYLAIVPSNYARTVCARMPLRRFSLPFDPPTYDVRMLWHRASDHHPGHQWIRQAIAGLFAA
jgi:DNA-binding transcriptional LysR family regulator